MDWLLSVPPIYRWTITLVFVSLVCALSVAPGIERPGDSIFAWLVVNTATPIQKAMHVVIYALLAFLWTWTLASVQSTTTRLVVVLIMTLGLGIALEWYQTNVPGRYGTITDVLLNTAGALIGLVVAFILI